MSTANPYPSPTFNIAAQATVDERADFIAKTYLAVSDEMMFRWGETSPGLLLAKRRCLSPPQTVQAAHCDGISWLSG